jgi:hypothetical protein
MFYEIKIKPETGESCRKENGEYECALKIFHNLIAIEMLEHSCQSKVRHPFRKSCTLTAALKMNYNETCQIMLNCGQSRQKP